MGLHFHRRGISAERQASARIIINKEVACVSIEALQRLNERDVLVTFPAQKPTLAPLGSCSRPRRPKPAPVWYGFRKPGRHMLVEHLGKSGVN